MQTQLMSLNNIVNHFFLRLPITPAIGRTARPGEVAMSMQGSPIHRMDQPDHPEFLVPLGRDKVSAHIVLSLSFEFPAFYSEEQKIRLIALSFDFVHTAYFL